MSSIYKKKCDVCLKEWDNGGEDNDRNTINLSISYRYVDDNDRDVCFDCIGDPKVVDVMRELVEITIKKDAEKKAEKEKESATV